MLRNAVYAVVIVGLGAIGFGNACASETRVYVTGKVRPSLLTICPCADPFVLDDNSLGEDLFLTATNLSNYEGARVEIVGERVDCGDCVKIDIRHIAFLPPPHAYGDQNGDDQVNAPDVVLAINYFFKGGPYPPNGWRATDLDANGKINIADLVRLVGLVYGRAATVQGAVWGSLPCLDTAGPYVGCRYWIILNSMPLDTGTVDEDGEFSALLPPDQYLVQFFPPESPLPGEIGFDLTHGDIVLPIPLFQRELIDSLLLVTLEDGVAKPRLDEIMDYLGGRVTRIMSESPVVKYVVALPQGLHVGRAAAILRLFPEIAEVETIPITCPE